MTKCKRIIWNLCPPAAWKLARALKPSSQAVGALDKIAFAGDYQSWEEAEQASGGYAAPEILAKTRTALLKVKNGEAAYERDSVVFPKLELPFPLLAGLLRSAATDKGRLSVLDFGGSLGSSYFQCRGYLLPACRQMRWSVVEQAAHVMCGRADFADEQLHFYQTVDECLQIEQPNVLLLSSVLAYLPDPYVFIREMVSRRFRNIIVQRMQFLSSNRDRLTIQRVPESIYPAVYPAWFFSETRFRQCFDANYAMVSTYPGADHVSVEKDLAYSVDFHFQHLPFE